MYPLLPFAVGVLAGALGVKMLRTGKAKERLDGAQAYLRAATVSSLNSIERSSASLRDRIEASSAPAGTGTPVAQAAKTPAAKTTAKRRAPAKPRTAAAKTEGAA